MAVVLPIISQGNYRSWQTLNLSTAADGFTGGDVLDCSGLSLSAMSLSTGANAASAYGFNVAIDSSTNLQPLLTSSGALLTVGSTAISPAGKTIGFDPSPFVGLRFIQPVSLTTGAGAPNAAGAQCKLGLSAFGYVP